MVNSKADGRHSLFGSRISLDLREPAIQSCKDALAVFLCSRICFEEGNRTVELSKQAIVHFGHDKVPRTLHLRERDGGGFGSVPVRDALLNKLGKIEWQGLRGKKHTQVLSVRRAMASTAGGLPAQAGPARSKAAQGKSKLASSQPRTSSVIQS